MNIRKIFTCLVVLLTLTMNFQVINADEDTVYGIVSFEGETGYTSINNGQTSFDAAYGNDALYLYSKDGNIYFLLNGDKGYISEGEAEIIPYEEAGKLSSYYVKDDVLYHLIRTDASDAYYTYTLPIDDRPDYLVNNSTYYSYDGKYFYTSFEEMADDYRNDTNEAAVNAESPYYNYYAYLPLRSYTNYSLSEIEDYFYNVLGIDGQLDSYEDLSKDGANDVVNLSQYYDNLVSFFTYEEIYGTNALRLLSESINESAYGKSYSAYVNNNVYTNAAYDSDEEREEGRYNNIDTSIYAHAKYFLSRAYANNRYDDYNGSHLGNKLSGVSAYYSEDPYNGDKVVSNYYLMDAYLGYKDKDAYTIGIIEDADELNIYGDEEESDILFTLNNKKDYALIILEDLDGIYKAQLDPSFNSDYFYNAEDAVGYIDAEDIDYLIGSENIKESAYYNIDFDFGDGTLHNEDYLSLKIKEGKTPVMVNPYLEGYDFKAYDSEVTSATEDRTYYANYEAITKVEIASKARQESIYGEPLNIAGGSLKISYEGGGSKEVPFTTAYVKGVEDGRLILEYNSFEVSQSANLSYDEEDVYDELNGLIEENIESYLSGGTYDMEELNFIKNTIQNTDYSLDFEEIRVLDEIFMKETREDVNYSFEKFDYDISVSGLALAMEEPGILKIFKPFKDTYFIRVGNVTSGHKNRADSIASAYGFEDVLSLKLNIQFNLRTATLKSPIVVSLKIDNKEDYSIYTVYHVDSDGNVRKCETAQSDNYIRFITDEAGDYFVYKKSGFNDFSGTDFYENLNINNADADNHLLFINGSILFAIGVLGALVIVVHIMLNRKQEKIWKDYRKFWQPVASPQEEKPKN